MSGAKKLKSHSDENTKINSYHGCNDDGKTSVKFNLKPNLQKAMTQKSMQGIRDCLKRNKFLITKECEIPNGNQMRLSNGSVVNIYTGTGKINVLGQNKDTNKLIENCLGIQ